MIWDPFEEIEKMHEEMDKLFNSFLGGRPQLALSKKQPKEVVKFRQGFRIPVCHVYETEGAVIASIELPGVDKKDIDINLTEDSLEVEVSHKEEKKTEKEGAYSYGKTSQHFYRKVPLPAEVIGDKAEATFKNGIVRIEIPKAKPKEKEKKRKLDIK